MLGELETINDEPALARWLSDSSNEGKVVHTQLEASDRVIARVTDGIYRQPASALRELISNAWDADATNVTILTDAPRFSRVYVRDDGSGMSYETLSRLLKNIGGSAKRREDGKNLGITSAKDAERTPGGRSIIGKIGIGLFSVSQLCRRFEIITKTAGTNYRLLAEIKLRVYDDSVADYPERDDDDMFVTGDVIIRREHTDDVDAHGTDIIMDDIKPRVREILKSADRWRSVKEREDAKAAGDLDTYNSMRVTAPVYHAGYIEALKKSDGQPVVLDIKPNLPWSPEDPAGIRMAKLMDAVEGEFTRLDRPDLAGTLDTYLEMIWTLGLCAPVGYVEKHPFDLTADDKVKVFWINKERGKGIELPLEGSKTIRETVHERAPGNPVFNDGSDPLGRFTVIIDGVELKRPIRFHHRQTDRRGLEHAIMFVGKFAPDLSKISATRRGGDLSLDGYLYWTGRVIPKENNGVLVRIRGTSGAVFDETFFKYQVSEQTRLRQISSEIFVHEGLDAALNIDRESFNFSHPHLQLVSVWLHNSIRQLTNRLKDEAAKLRNGKQQSELSRSHDVVTLAADRVWRERHGDAPPPDVVMVDKSSDALSVRESGSYPIVREELPYGNLKSVEERQTREVQSTALVQVLTAYGVLENLTFEEQKALIAAVFGIFVGGND